MNYKVQITPLRYLFQAFDPPVVEGVRALVNDLYVMYINFMKVSQEGRERFS